MRLRKVGAWIFGTIGVLVLLLIAISFFIDEPLRKYMEREINHRLTGYTVRIGRLDFHPIGFSLELEDFVLTQNANPTPPIAEIRKFSADIQWRALLRGRIVSNYRLERPAVILNLKQAEQEAKDETPVKERGWQEAVKRIYPVKINHFEIIDGDLTYIDNSPLQQVHFRQIHFVATNILNVESAPHIYPSPVHLEGTVFETGRVRFDGQADFLAAPHPGVKTGFSFEQVNLRDLAPLIRHLHVVVNKGSLSGTGEIEYAPRTKVIHVEKMTIDQAQADYLYQPGPAASEAGEKTKETAKEASETETAPTVLIHLDRLEIKKSSLGFVNKGAHPEYRVFVEETEFNLTHFSNHLTEGRSEANLKGKFMGSGNLGSTVLFRPGEKGPDLNLAISVEETDLRTMNDLLRAYGNFDVAAGNFSFFMEVAVREGQVTGYVKPLFKKLKVYDRRQDKEKSAFHKLYEGLVGGISKLLENKPRDEVATRADISGRIENPQSSSWEIVVRLIQNAFIKAILPGFEKEVSQGR